MDNYNKDKHNQDDNKLYYNTYEKMRKESEELRKESDDSFYKNISSVLIYSGFNNF